MNFDELKKMSIVDLDLVFFDCEFTGLDIGKHELSEIGYIKAKAKTFEEIGEGEMKIKPLHIEDADPTSLKISGYDEEVWAKEGFERREALEKFLEQTEGCVLVGHNVANDLMFLRKALSEEGLVANFHYKSLDTFCLAWAKFKEDDNFRTFSLLRELAPHFGVDTGNEHRALDDARTTYGVFRALMEI